MTTTNKAIDLTSFFQDFSKFDGGALPDREFLEKKITDAVAQFHRQGNLEAIARQMSYTVGIDRLLPECYLKFQHLVTESMIFLLQELPLERLIQKILDQVMLDPEASPGQRLCALVNDMPSLQKLGQIICRTPGLSPDFKQSLVDLEDNVGTVIYEDIIETLEREFNTDNGKFTVEIEKEILAEGSMCVVVAARIHSTSSQHSWSSVMKLLKPGVRENLPNELELLNRLSLFLDENRVRWGLGDFRFEDTLQQIRWLLENEVNLTLEQGNLKTAGRYHHPTTNLVVPECLPCSKPSMTVMTRIEGSKITDVMDLTNKQRRQLASMVAEACILRPLKDLGDKTIFHGDPHAGNIAYRYEKSSPEIIFYDWGMMGSLNRLERFAMSLMAMGVAARSTKAVLFAADIITGGKIFFDHQLKTDIQASVKKILDDRRSLFGEVLTDTNTIIGEFCYHGVIFPTDLLMFQKALVTLKGVLKDIDPTYNDDRLIWIALNVHISDLCHPRYYYKIFKEMFAIGWYSAGRLITLQRLIFKLSVELGLSGFNDVLRQGRTLGTFVER